MKTTRGRGVSIIILSTAIGLRLLLFFTIGSWHEEVSNEIILVKDALGYHNMAVNLLEHNVFSESVKFPYTPHIRRVPLYPLYLSAVYLIFGYRPYIALLFQLILGAMTCVLTYKLGYMFMDRRYALWAGLIASFDYIAIVNANVLLTGTMFTLLFMLHVRFLLLFLRKEEHGSLVLSAVFLGVATLCRPVSVYYAIFLAIPLSLHFKGNRWRGISRYFIILSVFLMTIGPWILRNYMVSGELLLSSQQKAVLDWYLPKFGKADSERFKGSIAEVIVSKSRKYVMGGISFFLRPGVTQYFNILRIPYNNFDTKESFGSLKGALNMIRYKASNPHRFAIALGLCYLLLIYATMCIGVYYALKKNDLNIIALFLTVIAYFLIASGTIGHSRYRLPAMPYIILLACYGLNQIREKFKRWRIEHEPVESGKNRHPKPAWR